MWRVLLLVTCAAALLPPEGVFFLKFFKVGGTTVAEVLGRLGERDEREICCSRAECEVCYTHASLARYSDSGKIVPRGAFALTLLRHPVEREVSRYYFARAVGDKAALRHTIEQWVAHVPKNEYTTVLGRGSVDAAVRALDRDFSLVGLTERTNDLLTALGMLFNETPDAVAQRPLKRVVDRPRVMDLSASTVATLTARLAPDIEVYTRAALIAARHMSALIAEHSPRVVEAYARALEVIIASQPECTDERHSSPGLVGMDCYRHHAI